MRSIVTSNALAVALVALVGPASALAQDPTTNDPGPEGAATACLRVFGGAEVADETDAAALAQLLVDGEIRGEILDSAACEPDVTADETMDEPPRAATRGTPYVEFVAHGAGAAVQLAALARQSESASGINGLDQAARRLARWAGAQRRWLDRHPPQACYGDVHTQWRRGVVRVRDGAKGVRKAIRTLRPEPMRRAVRDLTAGTQMLVRVDLDSVGRACTPADQG